MNEVIRAQKAELRRRVRAVLAGLTASQIRRKSLSTAETLFASPWWAASSWIFCFMTLPGEVDTLSILERAWAEGRQVGIPRIRGGEILFHLYAPDAGLLAVNRYGIQEPLSEWPLLAPEDAPPGGLLVVCPGLAFDRRLHRLGRGGGYYDRFLGNLRARPAARFAALGVCFREQLLDSLPVEARDQRLDALVCENGIITPARSGA
jgi:5-formyltetrahydrofolate cyclo-ligase